MKRLHIHTTAHSSGDPASVYRLLADGSTWPEWSDLGSFELESPAPEGGEGVGAIRVFRTGRYTSRERVAEVRPPERFSYELLSGLPLRRYRADVDLTPTVDGTDISWSSSFEPSRPGTGWIYRRALAKFIASCVEGLARAADAPT
jgi:hypothetical protein